MISIPASEKLFARLDKERKRSDDFWAQADERAKKREKALAELLGTKNKKDDKQLKLI